MTAQTLTTLAVLVLVLVVAVVLALSLATALDPVLDALDRIGAGS
jgi:hypothetical protein